MKNTPKALLLTVLLTALSIPLAGQATNAKTRLVENSKALRQYSWTTRSEAHIGGKEVVASLDKMRYDIDGRLQKTGMGGSGQPTAEQRALIDAVLRAAMAYAQPNPGKAAAFFDRAEVWEGRSGSGEGTMRVEGAGMIQSNDRVDIRMINGRAHQMTVESAFDGQPLTLRAEYRSLTEEGPTYVARMTVSYPGRFLELKVENFDYQENTSLAASAVPVERTVAAPAGSELRIRLAAPLSTKNAQTGQSFDAMLDRDLVIEGTTIAERGSKVVGKIVQSEGSGRVSGRATMTLAITQIQAGSKMLAVSTEPLSFEAESTKGRDAKRIGVATGVGTLIGAIAGGGKGAAIGAGAGAGVGVGTTAMTKGKEVEFGAEQQLVFKLSQALQVIVKQ